MYDTGILRADLGTPRYLSLAPPGELSSTGGIRELGRQHLLKFSVVQSNTPCNLKEFNLKESDNNE